MNSHRKQNDFLIFYKFTLSQPKLETLKIWARSNGWSLFSHVMSVRPENIKFSLIIKQYTQGSQCHAFLWFLMMVCFEILLGVLKVFLPILLFRPQALLQNSFPLPITRYNLCYTHFDPHIYFLSLGITCAIPILIHSANPIHHGYLHVILIQISYFIKISPL